MSAFDLGLRLAAHHTGRVVPRAIHRLQPQPLGPVVVYLAADKRRTVATSATTSQQIPGDDTARLFLALYAAGFDPECVLPPTLVVLNRAALGDLDRAARDAADHRDPRVRGAAALIGGYTCASAEHPGSSGVVVALDAARARWATGEGPAVEQTLATWIRWLRLPAQPVAALFALTAKVLDGAAMPFEAVVHGNDRARHRAVCNNFGTGRDWRKRDSRMAAALGLASREHAAELYDAGLLTDPIYAAAAIHDGTVTAAVATGMSKTGNLTVATFASRLPVCRLREGKQVEVIAGETTALPLSALHRVVGTVTDVSVASDGTVMVSVRVPRPRDSAAQPVQVGSRYLIGPQRPDSQMQARSRQTLASRYGAKGCWLTGTAQPKRIDREVPLDVIVRAAAHED